MEEGSAMSNTELIRELRSLTQAGMKDCKDALVESNFDLQKAVDIIKVKGLNVVSGCESKVASEGMVVITKSMLVSAPVAMVEINCQTDFVANGSAFHMFAMNTANLLQKKFSNNEMFSADDVESARKDLVSSTKENVVVRRWWVEEAVDPNAKVFTYVHSNNKIGVMLTLLASLEEMTSSKEFVELGDNLAMQVAAMNPLSVSSDKLNPEAVARQKTIFETQLTELNKPQAAWAKILEGKFNKWYTDTCLLNQESVTTPKTSVKDLVASVATKLGGTIEVVSFTRCQVGEGIEIVKENLADEITKMTGIEQPKTYDRSAIRVM